MIGSGVAVDAPHVVHKLHILKKMFGDKLRPEGVSRHQHRGGKIPLGRAVVGGGGVAGCVWIVTGHGIDSSFSNMVYEYRLLCFFVFLGQIILKVKIGKLLPGIGALG